jgi:hypothetical protein
MKTSKKELWIFLIIAFLWMWLLNAPRVMAAYGLLSLPPILSTILGYTGVFGPGVAAFFLTHKKSGGQGVKILWKRGWITNFPKKWWLPALFLMPAMGLLKGIDSSFI